MRREARGITTSPNQKTGDAKTILSWPTITAAIGIVGHTLLK